MALAVAWIPETEAQQWARPPVVHIQRGDSETTLCGLSLVDMELDFWYDQDEDWPGCKRCGKSLRARARCVVVKALSQPMCNRQASNANR